jgi:CheY-like chemotaxis protein
MNMASLAMLAQASDDVGGASRLSSILALLFIAGLFAYGIIKSKLKDAEFTEKQNELLQKKVRDLELEKEREREDEEMAEPLNETSTVKHGAIRPAALVKSARRYNIIHLDDEEFVLDLVKSFIRKDHKDATVYSFQNGDAALESLLQTSPDLFITDLHNNNVPGRKEKYGRSGFELISILAERNVKYPVIVISGSLSNPVWESEVRRVVKSRLDLSLMSKPFTPQQLLAEVSKYIKPANPIPKSESGVLVTPPAQAISPNAGYCPHAIDFQIGGYCGRSHKINHIGNGRLEYRYALREYNWGEPLVLQPDIEHWKQFKQALDVIGVWSWKTEYPNIFDVRDGTYWTLALKIGECSVSSTGKNAYPDSDRPDYSPKSPFGHLLNAVQNLTGIKDIR